MKSLGNTMNHQLQVNTGRYSCLLLAITEVKLKSQKYVENGAQPFM